jgi:hypothetical protein
MLSQDVNSIGASGIDLRAQSGRNMLRPYNWSAGFIVYRNGGARQPGRASSQDNFLFARTAALH